ncbi:MAG: GAF domain-containing protein [Rudaea sp.]
MQDSLFVTSIINLLALAAGLWLGLYIITRSFSSLHSWLATLMLAALSTFFFCNALLTHRPGNTLLAWLQQVVIFVLPLMLHLSYLLLPAPFRSHGLTSISRINRLAIPAAYLIGVLMFVAGALPTRPAVGLLFFTDLGGLQIPGQPPTVLYPIVVLYLALISGLTIWNLYQARAHATRRSIVEPFSTFMAAALIAGVGGLYVSLDTWFSFRAPHWPGELLIGIGVVLVGVAVARYSALLEGRPIARDFIYSLLLVGALTIFFVVIVLVLYLGDQVSFLTLELTIVGTIAANSFFDALRLALDRFFYRQEFLQLRGNLRNLAREAGTGRTLSQQLQAVLDSLCPVLRIRQGLIALRDGEGYRVEVSRKATPSGTVIKSDTLATHEIVGLVQPEKKGLPGMKLLVPLLANGAQAGALVLGGKDSPTGFSDPELDFIQDLADQLGDLIYGMRQQESNARQLNEMAASFRARERQLQIQVQQMVAAAQAPAPAREPGDRDLTPMVEDAFRHFQDLAFLGGQELAHIKVISRECDKHATTLDRGKAVAEVLLSALGKLRPEGPEPDKRQVPSREWHPYLILYDSYVLDQPNREVMSRLYIGEGTFNRTRRKALQAVAQALAEIDAAA